MTGTSDTRTGSDLPLNAAPRPEAQMERTPAADQTGAPRDAICGDFGIRIGRDGTWYYHGSPIGRKPLVRLFASVLRREPDGSFWLVTPAERGRIEVDDAPFTAVALDVTGSGRDQVLTFTTNLDDAVAADAEHPIRVVVNPETDEPSPYILVRPGLEALLLRPVFYQLTELGEPDRSSDGEECFGVWSSGRFFPLGQTGEPP